MKLRLPSFSSLTSISSQVIYYSTLLPAQRKCASLRFHHHIVFPISRLICLSPCNGISHHHIHHSLEFEGDCLVFKSHAHIDCDCFQHFISVFVIVTHVFSCGLSLLRGYCRLCHRMCTLCSVDRTSVGSVTCLRRAVCAGAVI